jgi:hypothetical protein
MLRIKEKFVFIETKKVKGIYQLEIGIIYDETTHKRCFE